MRLWSIYHLHGESAKLYELAERLFLYGTGYSSVEIKIIIALLYAKSLFLNQEYVRCFELLQHEYIAFPHFASLLYAYGKYVIKAVEATKAMPQPSPLQASMVGQFMQSSARNYLGSAIGALEECQRCMVNERQGKLCYYLGKAFSEMKRPLKVQEFWGSLTKEQLDAYNPDKKKEVKTLLSRLREVKRVVQTVEKHARNPKPSKEEGEEHLKTLEKYHSRVDFPSKLLI